MICRLAQIYRNLIFLLIVREMARVELFYVHYECAESTHKHP